MKRQIEHGYYFQYFVSLIQTMFERPLPGFATQVSSGIRRRLEIDWEAVIADLWPTPATQTDEGWLLAAQLVVIDPLRWSDICPVLHTRLVGYKDWLFPLPPSAQAWHLNRDVAPPGTLPALNRLHAIRRQLYRFLVADPVWAAGHLRKSFEALLAPVLAERPKGLAERHTHLDLVALADAEGLTQMQIEASIELVPPPLLPRTTLTDELSGLLRGERYGAVRDKNYLYLRHAGYAQHVEDVGDVTPFHDSKVLLTEDPIDRVAELCTSVRRYFRSRFRCASDVTAVRLFANKPSLSSARYDPLDWTVALRADVSRSLRELAGTERKARRHAAKPESTDSPKRRRRIVTLEVPPNLRDYADRLDLMWDENKLYIDRATLKRDPVEGPGGLAWDEFIALGRDNRRAKDPLKADRYFIARAALARYDAEPLARWLGNAVPTPAAWARIARGVKRPQSKKPFSREHDATLLKLWKPYQRKGVWDEFAEANGFTAVEAKRRAEFVAFATRHRNLTVEELNDLAQVELRLGARTWREQRAIARRACQ